MRKRSSKSPKPESNRQPDDFSLNVDDVDEIVEMESYHKNAQCIQAYSAISIVYGVSFLYLILNNDNYLHIGKASFLFILFFHMLLEFLKYVIYQILVNKKIIKLNIVHCLQFILTYFSLALLFHFVMVLFGADLTVCVEGTFVFSCTLVSLVLIPLFFYCGIDALFLLTLYVNPKNLILSSILNVSFSSVIGAWFGAFVIPLDWDRKWQVWPIPCAIGSLFGFVFGHTFSFLRVSRCLARSDHAKL